MGNVDLLAVARLLAELPEVLPAEELAVQQSLPRISPADALDTALRRSIAHLRYELNRESFDYLRWKVEQTRVQSERVRSALASPRVSRETPDADKRAAPSREALRNLPVDAARAVATARTTACRSYVDARGNLWTVTELATGAADGDRAKCLVFTSEESVSCLWRYPLFWDDLSDGLLDALRRQA